MNFICGLLDKKIKMNQLKQFVAMSKLILKFVKNVFFFEIFYFSKFINFLKKHFISLNGWVNWLKEHHYQQKDAKQNGNKKKKKFFFEKRMFLILSLIK